MHSHPTTSATAGAETTGPSLGAVVLDIGGDLGALVVGTPSHLEACEIEIRRVAHDWDGTHVAVRSRPSAGVPVYAAVFGGLRTGSYELRLRGGQVDGRVQQVEVSGGRVTETTWRDPDPADRTGAARQRRAATGRTSRS